MIGISLPAGVGLDPAGRFVAVHHRQLNIHQDQIRTPRGDRPQCFFAVPGFADLVAGMGEEIAQDLPVIFLVLNHQNVLAHSAPPAF